MWRRTATWLDMARTYSVGPMPRRWKRRTATPSPCCARSEAGIRPAPWQGPVRRRLGRGAATPYAENFMGRRGIIRNSSATGSGSRLDEFPLVAKGPPRSLRPAGCFTLEPKFVFPGEGAVGIENTYLVTATGSRPDAARRGVLSLRRVKGRRHREQGPEQENAVLVVVDVQEAPRPASTRSCTRGR